ncbi:hypothetical protein GCM10023210_34590 [Chryseobacterium ginsengisoli]|uniref:Uncharacterized protein n=1 Tax=Chryseobacterium ginsengisoli TaxID=363853 RepID=A0ABP9MR84_9FLAO
MKITEEEIYDLKYTLSDLIYPRLKVFKEKFDKDESPTIPNFKNDENFNNKFSREEKLNYWKNILEEMLFPFGYYSGDIDCENMEKDEINKKIEKGLNAFAKYFNNLWI